jgi:hypothetical protein
MNKIIFKKLSLETERVNQYCVVCAGARHTSIYTGMHRTLFSKETQYKYKHR